MIALVQRVAGASVEVEGNMVGRIGPGLLIFLGVAREDGQEEAEYLSSKAANLRIFSAGDGKFDKSLLDTGGEALVVSQFTLLASWKKGRRPSFTRAAEPQKAEMLVESLASGLEKLGITTKRGVFGANMKVSIENDGPVTIWMDTQSPL